MNIAVELALIVASIAGLLAVMAGVRALAARFRWSPELQRKCVHVATGLFALSLPLIFAKAWPVLVLSTLAVVVLGAIRLPPIAKTGIGSTIHGVERESYGEILLAVAVGFTFFRSIGNPVLYVLPMLVLTFSDAAAALTGVHYGRRIFSVEDGTKSLEGVVMFFLMTFIIAMVTLLLMTDISRQSVILLSLVVAVFGAQLEAESWRGFDNLFVPVGLHLFLQNNLTTSPFGLLIEAVALIGGLVALMLLAPSLGLTRHAARTVGVLAFLILSVTSPLNAILPLAAFAAFILARRNRPIEKRHSELDFIAAAAVVAAMWLLIGELFGSSAINLYNLTFAGVAAVFAVQAMRRYVVAAIFVLVLLGFGVLVIAPFNPSDSQWVTPFAPWVIASLAICTLVAWLRPTTFDTQRSGRAFAIALATPLILLTWSAT
jgi:dolichol kinase